MKRNHKKAFYRIKTIEGFLVSVGLKNQSAFVNFEVFPMSDIPIYPLTSS